MPLGEWLNSVILQQAEEGFGEDEDSYGQDMSSVHERLDDITRRLDQFGRKGPEAYAPKQSRQQANRGESDQLAQLISRLDQRLEQFTQLPRLMAPYAPPLAPMHPQMPAGQMPLGLDRAVAEIAARQRSLNGAAPQGPAAGRPQPQAAMPQQAPAPQPMPPQAYMPAPVPTQDLSGLEQHLRQITDQIETLRRPGVEDAINALRAELGDIGRALNEAMPRQAIDTIEKQIQGLTHRIAEGRQNGADAGALSGIEHGLAEVRDVLRGLTPAESLVGFNEAVDGLAHKIDLIVAQRDPQALGQLEHAITTLREMAGHVASGDAVSRLALQVQELGDKVEHFAAATGGDALNNLEHRISALADALAERSQNGAAVPPRLEALVESLSDKIEQIQQSRGDNIASTHLEDQIVALVRRLDASDSRLGHLEVIERGLADLLVHIEEIRSNKSPSGLREENSPGVVELKQEIARTQSALDAVHGTLGLVVDRLATIEKGVRGEARVSDYEEPLELTQPVGKIGARAVVNQAPAPAARPQQAQQPQFEALFETPAPAPVTPTQMRQGAQSLPELTAALAPQPQTRPAPPAQQPAPAPSAPKRLPPAARLPINPDLPPDQPLEPGSGGPRYQANPAARIAASEAALGGARPQREAGPAGKSGFIAAARRAAQSAMESAKPRKPEPQPEPIAYDEDEATPLRQSVMKKVKSLFVAASLIAIVVGGIQIASTFYNFGSAPQQQSARSPAPAADRNGAGDIDAADSQPAANSPQVTHSLNPAVKPSDLPGYMISAPQGIGTTGNLSAIGANPVGSTSPSLLSAPALNPPSTSPGNDITGTIPRAAKSKATPATVTHETEQLPIAIGSQRLREAAVAGDAGAAYEVAMRFAEGRGVAANPEEAARWYERAAGKGLAAAQFHYASMLEKGRGVKKNIGQARRLYLAAATKGHAKAMHNLAVLYAEGIDGRPDYGTAGQWFRKAAMHGVGDSQYNLGVLCARGLGTDKNLGEAYQWFALAAAQGDREAGRKRDELATHLEAGELTAAQQAVKTFAAEKQPQEATAIPAPRGGWDDTSSSEAPAAVTKSQTKPSAPRAAAAANMPLNMSDFARR